MPLFRQHYPEAFDAEGKVDASKLVKGLEERPLTEVQKAGSEGVSGGDVEQTRIREERTRLQHLMETAGYQPHLNAIGEVDRLTDRATGRSVEVEDLPVTLQPAYERLLHLQPGVANELRYSPHYSISTNPRGGTEIAVVAKGDNLPSDAHHDIPGLLGTATVEEKTLGELRATMGKDHPKLARFAGKPDEAVIGVQTEAQSDWEGDRRAAVEDTIKNAEARQDKANGKWFVFNKDATRNVAGPFESKVEADKEIQRIQDSAVSPHPLLPYWERLVADAVIQHGLERGWEGVVAMTEGHDSASRFVNEFKMEAEQKARLQKLADEKGLGIQFDKSSVSFFDKETDTVVGEMVRNNQMQHVWQMQAMRSDLADWIKYHLQGDRLPDEFPGHAQHYGDPDFRIGTEETPGSLQQEFAKATGEENTLRKGGGNVLAVGEHKGTEERFWAHLPQHTTQTEDSQYISRESIEKFEKAG
jgi:hypothetical protein